MPNIKSAKKRVITAAKRAEKNKAVRTNLRTNMKKANVALEQGAENAADSVKVAIKKIDQAAAKGLLHKNNAARKKSKLVRKLNASA